jgi:hypothetical protein
VDAEERDPREERLDDGARAEVDRADERADEDRDEQEAGRSRDPEPGTAAGGGADADARERQLGRVGH